MTPKTPKEDRIPEKCYPNNRTGTATQSSGPAPTHANAPHRERHKRGGRAGAATHADALKPEPSPLHTSSTDRNGRENHGADGTTPDDHAGTVWEGNPITHTSREGRHVSLSPGGRVLQPRGGEAWARGATELTERSRRLIFVGSHGIAADRTESRGLVPRARSSCPSCRPPVGGAVTF